MPDLSPIRHENGRPLLLAGIRRQHPFSENGDNISQQWRQFQALGTIPQQCGQRYYGVSCGHDQHGFEYMSATEVSSFEQLPAGLGRMRIPAQHYAVFRHYGHIATLRDSWLAIYRQWLPASGYQSAHQPDFEVYDQRFDPLSGSGEIEIWLSISPAAPTA